MKTVVVGVTDDERSLDALSLGAAFSKTLSAPLAVAAAIEYAPLPIETIDYDRARAKHFARIFERVDERLGDYPYRRFELDQDAQHGLALLAEQEDASLIVIGTTHRGRLGQIYPGTSADAILTSAPCAVAVAPHGYGAREHVGTGLIGVAYDGSDEAREALAFADALSLALGCEIRLITVVPVPDGVPDPLGTVREEMYRERMNTGMRAIESTRAKGVLELGNPAEVLARHAVDLDMVVIGSRGHGPVLRTVLGSVASNLVRTAPCPVIVTPRSARESIQGPRAGSAHPGVAREGQG